MVKVQYMYGLQETEVIRYFHLDAHMKVLTTTPMLFQLQVISH